MADDRARVSRADPAATRATHTRGQQTILRLLTAGREALREVGYGDLRVDDVVGRAGASHGTFYLYFSGKRDLLDALRGDLLAVTAELGETLPVLDANPETRVQLEIWVSDVLRLLGPQDGVLRALMGADATWDWREVTSIIEAALTRRIKIANGANLAVAPEHIAWAISAMIIGLATGAPTSPDAHSTFAGMLHRATVQDAA